MRSGWPCQVLGKHSLSGSKSVWKNHRAQFWQNATGPLPGSPPLSAPAVFFNRQPWSYCAKPARNRFVLADCVRFWLNGSGPEVSRCASIIQAACGQCFRSDPDGRRIGSGMFTGIAMVRTAENGWFWDRDFSKRAVMHADRARDDKISTAIKWGKIRSLVNAGITQIIVRAISQSRHRIPHGGQIESLCD